MTQIKSDREILIVDDEKDILELLQDVFEDEGFLVRTALSGAEAIEEISKSQPSLLLQDIWLKDPQFDGLKVLETVKQSHPHLPVIMMSGHGTVETAVRATRMGAYDFVEKPFKADKLMVIVNRALETSSLSRQLAESTAPSPYQHISELVGHSPAIEKLRQAVERISETNSRVLITGEAGSGKEALARLVHRNSPRAQGPFISLNCNLVSPETFEATLFGKENEEGQVLQVGQLEMASRGTLLLNEVLEMPLSVQSKLARALHLMSFQRVNGQRSVQVNVRVIATTMRDPQEALSEKTFSEDLYYRLNVVPLHMPCLTDRAEDILPLFADMMSHLSFYHQRIPCRLSEEAQKILMKAKWPGNLRQLRNFVEWVVIMYGNDKTETILGPEQLSSPMLQSPRPFELPSSAHAEDSPVSEEGAGVSSNVFELPLKNAREVFEREYLVAQVERFGGNISKTAEFVGMERSALHRKLKSLDVKRAG